MITAKIKTPRLLIDRLRDFRLRQKRIALFRVFLNWAFYSFAGFFLILVIQSWAFLPSAIRWMMLLGWVIPAGTAGLVYVLPVFWDLCFRPQQPPLNEIALQVGRQEGQIQDRLANALQLIERRGLLAGAYSTALIDRAWEEVAVLLGDRDFLSLLPRQGLARPLRRMALLVAGASIFALVPQRAGLGFERMFNPNSHLSARQGLDIRVWPGTTDLLKGEDLVIRARASQEVEALHLCVLYPGHTEKRAMDRCEQDTFCLAVRGLKDTVEYYVAADRVQSPTFTIRVLEFPLLRSLQIELFPPAYTGDPAYRLDKNIGDLSALEGTRVQWQASANKPLQEGSLVFAKSPRLPMRVSTNDVAAAFTIKRADQYSYELRDVQGMINRDAITYHIRIIPDQGPYLRILSPAKEVDLDEEMRLPLLIYAQDDYGFSQMRIGYQILPEAQAEYDSSRFRYIPVPISSYKSDQIQVAFDWDLSSSPLLPNEALVYFVEVYDNDTVNGPKKAASEMYWARFPSIFELYKEISAEQDDAISNLEAIHEKSEELKEKVTELSLQLKRMEQLSWEKKQEIGDAVKEQKNTQEALQQISQRLDEMIQKLDENNLLSQETQEKYQEIQQLYREIMTPELERVLEKVEEAMQKLDQSLLQKAMEEFRLSEETFNKSLDRTISLLKRLKMQQQVEQALRITQEIAERQNQLGEKAGKEPGEREKEVREQESLKTAAESLQQQLKDMREAAADEVSRAAEEISKAAEAMKQAEVPPQMERSAEEIARGNRPEIQARSASIQSDMQQVASHLKNASSALSGAMQQRAMQAMKKSMNDLLSLSQMQEALKQKTQSMPETAAGVPAAAETQQQLTDGLQRVTDELYAASKESFGIQSSVGASLGQAANQMKNTLGSFEGRNLNAASQSQGQAMSAMNDAVMQLFSSMQNMMSGGQGGGMSMEQFMQQLQNMAGRQQGINAETEAMGPGERLGMARQAAMERLAAQQGALRKSLEDLLQELGQQGSGAAGSLEKVAEEMKEVEKELSQSGIDRQTLERQNRILSRMLDAQKSVREREYSRKRKAETGKEYLALSPAEGLAGQDEAKDRLQQDLLRAKREGYTRDYLELIRQYFEALTDREANEKKP